MTVQKTVSFRDPYTGATFQRLVELMEGRDGYLSGGEVTEAGGFLTVAAYQFVQFGIVGEETEATANIAVPTDPEPWFVLASLPDDEPSSGITLSATPDVTQVLAGSVVIAYKTNGQWKNPRSLRISRAGEQAAAESGAEAGFRPYPTTSGTSPVLLTDVKLSRGLVVDPAGSRRQLDNATTDPTESFRTGGMGLARDGEVDGLPRTDYAVLRQNEDGTGSIVPVFGNSQGQGGADGEKRLGEYQGSDEIVLTGTGTRPASFGRRGDRGLWHVWGNGSSLYVGGEKADGPVGSQPLLGASGTPYETAMAGLRADGSIVALYSDRTTADGLAVVAFDVDSTAVDSGPTTFTTAWDAYKNTRAVIAPGDVMHVVTQETFQGGSPQERVVYFKVSVADAAFGTVLTGPVYFASSTNDVYPSIGLDRRGHVHIAYTTGTFVDTYGTLRYIELDAEGNEVSNIAPTVYAGNADPHDPKGLDTVAFDHVHQPRLVVTPHDEVYVFAAAKLTGVGTDQDWTELVVYSPTFERRYAGHQFLWLSQLFGATVDGVKNAMNVFVDDHGAFFFGAHDENIGLVFARLDTAIAPNGIVGESYLEGAAEPGDAIADDGYATIVDLNLAPTGLGGAVWGYENAGASVVRISGQRFKGRRPTPHPKDVYLAAFDVERHPSDSPVTYPAREEMFRSNRLRPKTGSKTLYVGDGGDFAGPNGLVEAIEHSIDFGGEVVVRGGRYYSGAPIVIPGGMTIRGESNAELMFLGEPASGRAWLTVGFPFGPQQACGADDTEATVLVLDATLEGATRYIRPGDLIETSTDQGTFNTVVEVLDSRRFIVADPVTTPASVIWVTVHSTNIDIDGVALNQSSGGTQIVEATSLKNCRLSALFAHGWNFLDHVAMVATACQETVFENFHFRSQHDTTDAGLQLSSGARNIVQGCVFGDQGGSLLVDADEERPTIIGCTGVPVTPPGDACFTFGGARTVGDTARMVNCSGIIGGPGIDGVATQVANNLIDQEHMSLGVPLADANNTTLPTNATSILGQLNDTVSYRDLVDSNGVISGLTPTNPTGTQVDIAAGEGSAGGVRFSVASPVSNTDSLTGELPYSYYLDTDGAIVIAQAAPVVGGTNLLVAYGLTAVGGATFDTFVDARRFIDNDTAKSPISVSAGEADYGSFASFEGALEWIRAVGPGNGVITDIVITEMLAYGATVTVDLTGIGSLRIKGTGNNGGFSTTADQHMLLLKAPVDDPAIRRSVTLEGLAFRSSFNGTMGAPSSSFITLDEGTSIDELVIRGCHCVEDPVVGYGMNQFFDVGTDTVLQRLVIAENWIQTRGSGIEVVPNGSNGKVDHTRIYGNTIRRGNTRGLGGYYGIQAHPNAVNQGRFWISDNDIDGDHNYGIEFGAPSGGELRDSVLSGNSVGITYESGTGLYISNVDGCNIANNRILTTGNECRGTVISNSEQTTFTGNSSRTFGTALDQQRGTALELEQCDHILVGNNYLECRMGGNQINSWTVYLGPSNTGFITLSGNIIRTNNEDRPCLTVQCQYVVVSGNLIRNNGASPNYAAVEYSSGDRFSTFVGNVISVGSNGALAFDVSGATELELGSSGSVITGANIAEFDDVP